MMSQSELNAAMQDYVALFGNEPVESGTFDMVERLLGVTLPDDFRHISSFYSGGLIGGISHNAISEKGPATNIVEETERLRKAISLPREYVVLAEPPESLVVLRTANRGSDETSVVWCSAVDAISLTKDLPLTNAKIWPSYLAFFRYLLDAEITERRES